MMYARRIAVLLAVLVVMPAVALAAPKTFDDLVDWFVGIIDLLIPTILTLMVVYYMWIGFNSTKNLEEGGLAKRSQIFGWGILILFVAVSIWGILRILQSSLDAAGSDAQGPSVHMLSTVGKSKETVRG